MYNIILASGVSKDVYMGFSQLQAIDRPSLSWLGALVSPTPNALSYRLKKNLRPREESNLPRDPQLVCALRKTTLDLHLPKLPSLPTLSAPPPLSPVPTGDTLLRVSDPSLLTQS